MKRDFMVMLAAIGIVAILAVAFAVGVFEPTGSEYDPQIDPNDFVAHVDNPYFPLTPGTTYVYSGLSEDGAERNEVSVTHDTKVIMGVTCTVVWDRVWLEGSLTEETYDWYAQDRNGSVWYFGEDSREIKDGVTVSTEGSWEAGVRGAKPGIVMQGHPVIGDKYRQEYLRGEAEDMAEIVAMNASVSVPFGDYTNCLQTKDWTPLEPGIAEFKFYASGVGAVREVDAQGGPGYMDLVDIIIG